MCLVWFFVTAITFPSTARIPGCFVDVPGKTAQEKVDWEIEAVHKHMNDDPETVGCVLAEKFPKDKPEFIPLCNDVIERSINTITVRYAIGALAIKVRAARETLSKSDIDQIAAAARQAVKRDDYITRIEGARVLSNLGNEYKPEAETIAEDMIHAYWNGKLKETNFVNRMSLPFCSKVVFGFFEEVLAKSKKTGEINRAAGRLGSDIKKCGKEMVSTMEAEKIVINLERIIENPTNGVNTRSNAAEVLTILGGVYAKYRDSGYHAYLDILSHPSTMDDRDEWRYLLVFRDVLNMQRPDSYPLLREKAAEYDIRNQLEHKIHSLSEADIMRDYWVVALQQLDALLQKP